ncbi:MAG TPA: glutaredoxin family protein [Polyangiaceae bacterium]|nr:glutaredoxin family protein [Polyangiaceae bacterium]
MRCPVHDLVVPPNGQCVLCRRAQATPTRAISGRLLIVAITVIATVCVAGIVVKLIGSAARSAPTANTLPNAGAVQTESRVASPAVQPTTALTVAEEFAPTTNAAAAPGAAGPGQTPVAADSALQPTAPNAPKPPSEADLRAALRDVKITLYSTDWCPHCTRARRWLQQNSIAFVEHDVEKNPDAKRQHRRLVPSGGVPVLDVDGDILSGFNEKRTAQAIAQATQRRLAQR